MTQPFTQRRSTAGRLVPRLAQFAPILLVCWSAATWGEESVQAQLSARELAYGQPVELTLTAQGEGIDSPDLSVLEPDFQILDRRVERRVAVRNGQRSAQVRLGLLLLPRRDGALVVPAIPFGQSSSEPLELTVEPATDQSAGAAAPRLTPSSPETFPSQPEATWGGGYSELPPFQPGPLPPAPRAPVPPIDLTLDAPEARNAEPWHRESAAPGLVDNPWFWVSLGLAGALAALLASRRKVPAAQSAAVEAPPAPPPPSTPLDLALAQVRAAYEVGDASAARESLLAWARLRWPEDPPGNLTRLAQRCPPPLRDHITRLEMAFFSPEPIAWERGIGIGIRDRDKG